MSNSIDITVLGGNVTEIITGENTAEARRQADIAVEAADRATISEAAAEALVGPIYASTAAGLAATANGGSFAVDNGDGTVTIWDDVAGVASNPRTMATTTALASAIGSRFVGRYSSVSALLASTALAAGAGKIWQAAQHTYVEADAGASDHHVTTAGAVKLYVLPVGSAYDIEAFGVNESNAAAVNTPLFHKAWDAAAGALTRLGLGAFPYDGQYDNHPVVLEGVATPSITPDRNALESGTIISGGMSFGHSFTMKNMGVDRGEDNFNTDSDVLSITVESAYDAGRQVILEDVTLLARITGGTAHTLKVEGYEQVSLRNVVCGRGKYGFALKSRNLNALGCRAIECEDAMILKADGDGSSTGAGSAYRINVIGFHIEGSVDSVHGLRVLAEKVMDGINVTGVTVNDVDVALVLEAGANITNCNFSAFSGDNIRECGIKTSGVAGIYRVSMSQFTFTNMGQLAFQFQNGKSLSLNQSYFSAKSGAMTYSDSFGRVEASVEGFVGSGITFKHDNGNGAAKPRLYITAPSAYVELDGIQAPISGNVPQPGYSSQTASTSADVTLNPKIDLRGRRSLITLDNTSGGSVNIVNINPVMPDSGTNVPNGYQVRVFTANASNCVFKHNGANLRSQNEIDLTRGLNEFITYEWKDNTWFTESTV